MIVYVFFCNAGEIFQKHGGTVHTAHSTKWKRKDVFFKLSFRQSKKMSLWISFRFVEKDNIKRTSYRHLFLVAFPVKQKMCVKNLSDQLQKVIILYY